MTSRSGAPEPEETVAFPDWVMLDRFGRTSCHDGHAAANEAVRNVDTAAAVHTSSAVKRFTRAYGGKGKSGPSVSAIRWPRFVVDRGQKRGSSGHSCYFSFTLVAPPKVSYLDLHWPERPANSVFTLPAYSYVLAADDDLVLLRISIVANRYNRGPSDLFVYVAGPPSSPPSALRLPLPAEPDDDDDYQTRFLIQNFGIGILRLAPADQDRSYIVAELDVSAKKKRVSARHHTDNNSSNGSSDRDPLFARLCVFSSETGTWRIITKRAPQPQRSNGGQFPACWWTDDVLPFDGRFLCWVDYFKGLLLSDFSKINSPVLHFVPFPGKQYTDDMIPSPRSGQFPGRFRSVAVSQGRIRFVHIDNDWHERDHSFSCSDCHERKRKKLGYRARITIWTLMNMMDGGNLKFEWEVHHVINLDCLWAQIGYEDHGLPRRLPEFPIIAADDPDVLCCVLREEEFAGKTWMIMVDMKYAYMRSCTPYIDFRNVPLLPIKCLPQNP